MWHVYILQCADSSFYVGLTEDLVRRLKEHQGGYGAVYTRERYPVTLIYAESYGTRNGAEFREKEIKNWGVANKLRLIKYGLGKRYSAPLVPHRHQGDTGDSG
jgi:putative endonuclease